ncbi:MAG TPA: arsenate reductase (glutaredoxin) [Caulobacteraceae bacterium]|jgi:arsenate reductase
MSGEITIFHNPNCGTSRKALAAIRAAGLHPNVVEYLKTGWTVQQLRQLLSEMKMSARDILRARGTPAEELGLTRAGVSDEAILAAMTQHPILVERPIVRATKGTVLARPLEKVETVL